MPAPKRRRLAAILLGLAVILTLYWSGLLSPQPAPRYTVTDLGVLPGCASSRGNAVNTQGDVAGTATQHGFGGGRSYLYRGGRLMDIGLVAGAGDSNAQGINSHDEITGVAWLPTGYHAFLYSGGKMRDLGTPRGFTDSEGRAINDRGEIVGNISNLFMRPGLIQKHAFLYSHGKMTDLGALPGSSESEALSINSTDHVAGVCYSHSGRVRFVPFLYDSRNRTMTALPMPPPYRFGYVYHINDHGQVAGDVSAGDGITHAALWDSGRLVDLGVPLGFTSSIAQGLNNHGEAVGRCFRDYNPVETFLRNHVTSDNALRRYLDRDTTRAFVYRDGKMQDLNELIPTDADWMLEDAEDINDRGQIVGQGQHHGQERAFLLTPIH